MKHVQIIFDCGAGPNACRPYASKLAESGDDA